MIEPAQQRMRSLTILPRRKGTPREDEDAYCREPGHEGAVSRYDLIYAQRIFTLARAATRQRRRKDHGIEACVRERERITHEPGALRVIGTPAFLDVIANHLDMLHSVSRDKIAQ